MKQVQKAVAVKQDVDDVSRLKRLLAVSKRQAEETTRTLSEKLAKVEKDLVESQQENSALKDQHLRLRDFVTKGQEELKKTRKELADAVNENVRLAKQVKLQKTDSSHSQECSTEQESSEPKQRIDQLERVIHFLRDRSEGAQLEAKQLREELQQSYEKIQLLEEEKPAAISSKDFDCEELKRDLVKLKEAAEKARTPQQPVSQDATPELLNIRQENQRLKEDSERHRIRAEEKDSQAKQAQQHLAKKVKENTILSEKIEEQKMQLLEAQHKLSEAQAKNAELQNILNMQEHSEQRLQDQLNEVVKSFDSQIQKWEEKYFQAYEKWQESELRNQSLRKLEEKYLHMQSMLAGLGTFISPSSFPYSSEPETQQEKASAPLQDPFGIQLNRPQNLQNKQD